MIRASNLRVRLENILAGLDKSADFASDVRCVDDGDGQHPRLEFWNEAKLGTAPTQQEVDAASDQPHPNIAIKKQLEAIDATTMKGVRGLREFILAQAAIIDALIAGNSLPPEAQISSNIGVQKVLQLEQAAAALRAQLVPE